ncbi:MAG: EAL domain-containing protein [Roseibium sp.]
MRIRTYLVLSFAIATLLPALIFSIWSYRDAVSREFAEVHDRHLLLARNLGFAMDRYQQDLVAALDALSATLVRDQNSPELSRLLHQMDLLCVLIVDKKTGVIEQHIATASNPIGQKIPAPLLAEFKNISKPEGVVFSDVIAAEDGQNSIYLVKDLDDHLAIGQITTNYLVNFGKNIAFGKKGHAAIVDRSGNVISHPKPDWVKIRKNIAFIPPVARMMNGETGIEEFYSPAIESDMIAGFTTVQGPGWGVMVPQPVSEIYDKVAENQSSFFVILAAALVAILALGLFLARSLSAPLESLARAVHTSARNRQLLPVRPTGGLIPFTEITEFSNCYNIMVRRMTRVGKQIEKLAFTDNVTGLPNRDRLQSLATSILRPRSGSQKSGLLLLVDLDNFKEVNDLHGHHVGDLFLKACAEKLTTAANRLYASDISSETSPVHAPIVARIGGDEFVVMIEGALSEQHIRTFLENLRLELGKPSPELDLNLYASASIGCTRFPEDGQNLDELIKRADIAMYHAKNSGKNQFQLYTPGIGTQSAAEIRRDLISAIENDELTLEYQPKICTRRRKVVSVEGLVRWKHGDNSRDLPDVWLPSIKGSHAMSRLGEWVIEQAMKDQKKMTGLGHDLLMSVNIGSNHFISADFVESVESIRSRIGFSSDRLEIEVTEDALFVSEHQAVSTFNRLHDLGYKVSIDDFGKGYSNIARLANLPVDFLKIDRSLIVGASDDDRVRTILESTIAMAKELGCKTVAEGVETLGQAEFATRVGADCLQGYYFSPSQPIADLINWLNGLSTSSDHIYLELRSEAV